MPSMHRSRRWSCMKRRSSSRRSRPQYREYLGEYYHISSGPTKRWPPGGRSPTGRTARPTTWPAWRKCSPQFGYLPGSPAGDRGRLRARSQGLFAAAQGGRPAKFAASITTRRWRRSIAPRSWPRTTKSAKRSSASRSRPIRCRNKLADLATQLGQASGEGRSPRRSSCSCWPAIARRFAQYPEAAAGDQ